MSHVYREQNSLRSYVKRRMANKVAAAAEDEGGIPITTVVHFHSLIHLPNYRTTKFQSYPIDERKRTMRNVLQQEITHENWSNAVLRLRTHPIEALSLTAEDHRTPLHLAVQHNPPLEFVQFLLDTHPMMGYREDVYGWTALALALASSREVEDVRVMSLLMRRCPMALSMTTTCGMTPVYLATWRGVQSKVLQLVLQLAPKCVQWPTMKGETALTLLWGQIEEEHQDRRQKQQQQQQQQQQQRVSKSYPKRKRIQMQSQTQRQILKQKHCEDKKLNAVLEIKEKDDDDDEAEEEVQCSDELLRKLEMFLKASHHGTVSDTNVFEQNRVWRILHAGAAAYTPPRMIQFLIRRYRHQICIRDEYGRLPLTLAATARVYASKKHDPQSQSQRQLKQNWNHNPTGSVIDHLVQAYPQAASIPDSNGRLPLSLAIGSQKGWQDGIQALVHAAPQALYTRDTLSLMYPFMFAAAVGRKHIAELQSMRQQHQHQQQHVGCNEGNSQRQRSQSDDRYSNAKKESIQNLGLVFELLREGPDVVDLLYHKYNR